MLQVMSTRTARRADNKEGTFITVKTGFKSIFTDPRLANITLKAVRLATPILIHRDLLANLHAVRLCEEGVEDADMPVFNQTFFNQCTYAVTRATGSRCEQFKPSTNTALATTLQLYEQYSPVTNNKPERPTFMKDVSSHNCIPPKHSSVMHMMLLLLTTFLLWVGAHPIIYVHT